MKVLSPALARLPAAGPVYLTFDDGPDERWTPHILDLLAHANVLATFFVVGRFALEQPELVRRIADQGHEVGNHSWSHRHPWTLSSAAARLEVRDGAAAIADLIGQVPIFSVRRTGACIVACSKKQTAAVKPLCYGIAVRWIGDR